MIKMNVHALTELLNQGTAALPLHDLCSPEEIALFELYQQGDIGFHSLKSSPVTSNDALSYSGIGTSGVLTGMDTLLTFWFEGSTLVRWKFEARSGSDFDFTLFLPALRETILESVHFGQVQLGFESGKENPHLQFKGHVLPVLAMIPMTSWSENLPELIGELRTEHGFAQFDLAGTFHLDFASQVIDHGDVKFGMRVGALGIEEEDNATHPEWEQGLPTFFLSTTFTIHPDKDADPVHVPAIATSWNPARELEFRIDTRELSHFALGKLSDLLHGIPLEFPKSLGNLHLEDHIQLSEVGILLEPGNDQIVRRLTCLVETSHPIAIPFPNAEEPAIHIRTAALRFSMQRPFSEDRTTFLAINASADFRDSEQLNISVTHTFGQDASTQFMASLAGSEDSKIADLFEALTGEKTSILPDLQVEEVLVRFETLHGTFFLAAELNDVWHHDFGHVSLAISHLGFTLERLKDGGYNVAIQGLWAVGSLHFMVRALHSNEKGGWDFHGDLFDPEPIALPYLLSALHHHWEWETDEDHTFPSFLLDRLDVRFSTHDKSFAIEADLRLENDIGVFGVELFTEMMFRLELSKDAKDNTRYLLEMAADLTIGEQEFDVRASLGTDEKILYASWQDHSNALTISNLLAAFDPSHSAQFYKDQGLDFGLRAVRFEYDYTADAQLLMASAETTHGIRVMCVGEHTDGKWKFLFVIEYDKVDDIHAVPAPHKEEISRASEFLNFQKVALVVATANFKDFELPELPALHGSEDPFKSILNDIKLTLDKGIYFKAEVELNHAEAAGNLKTLGANHTTLLVSAGYDATLKSFVLEGELLGEIAIPTSSEDPLILRNLGLRIGIGSQVSFFLHGSCAFNIDRHRLTATGNIGIEGTSLVAMLNVDFSGEDVHLFGMDGMILDEFGFLLGINFLGPRVEIGLEGGMHRPKESRDAEFFGMILEMEGELPNPKYFELRFEHLGLEDVFNLFKGKSEEGHATTVSYFSELQINNFNFYWAEDQEILPNGSVIQPGFSFNGDLIFFSWAAHADLTVNKEYGISGSLILAPVTLNNVFELTGTAKNASQGYSVKRRRRPGKDWETIPSTDVSKDPPETEFDTLPIVAPHGAIVQVNSNHSPYFIADVRIVLASIIDVELHAEVDDTQLTFDLHFNLGTLIQFNLGVEIHTSGSFKGMANFWAGLDFSVGATVHGVYYGVHIQLGAGVDLQIGITPKEIEVSASFSANIFGLEIQSKKLEVDIPLDDLGSIPKKIGDSISSTFFADFESIIEFIFDRDAYLRHQRKKELDERRKAREKEHSSAVDRWDKQWEKHRKDIDQQVVPPGQSKFEPLMNEIRTRRMLVKQACDSMGARIVMESKPLVDQIQGDLVHVGEIAAECTNALKTHHDDMVNDSFDAIQQAETLKFKSHLHTWNTENRFSALHTQKEEMLDEIRKHAEHATVTFKTIAQQDLH